MARPTIQERARAYVAAMPEGVSGSGRHNATVAVANVLLHGFALSEEDAWVILREYDERCVPPSGERKLAYRMEVARRFSNPEPRGWLIGDDRARDEVTPPAKAGKGAMVAPARPRLVYDAARLRDFAGSWAGLVDVVWLANRSAVDPALVGSAEFLSLLYGPEERVLCFHVVNREGNPWTQGEAVWPVDAPLRSGRCGVWYLTQPVDGEYRINPRSQSKKLSRRSEESVLRWPFLVLESDEAPVREWLGALVRLPLRIVAIYSSGGRSVHALVRVDARTKGHWDEIKAAMMPGLSFLVLNGADKGVFSAVRLSRLPGALREGKMAVAADGSLRYERYARPALQKLLYVQPDAGIRPICDLPVLRDVESDWCGYAASEGDADNWVRDGLAYYARCSARCRERLAAMADSV